MLSFLAQEIAAAIAENDAARADCEACEAKRAKQLKKKSSDDGLIYKTVERPAPQQQSAATMDPEQQKLWDLWVTRHIANAFAGRPTFCEAQSEALAYVIHKLRQEWRKEIGEKLAELRSDMMRNDSVLECWPRKKQHVA